MSDRDEAHPPTLVEAALAIVARLDQTERLNRIEAQLHELHAAVEALSDTTDDDRGSHPIWLTKREAAERARLSRRTIERAIASEALRSVGGGSDNLAVRIRSTWLDEWLERRTEGNGTPRGRYHPAHRSTTQEGHRDG